MVYKRYPYLHRNYYYPTPRAPREKSTSQSGNTDEVNQSDKDSENIKPVEEIPMPNEEEDIKIPEASSASGLRTPFSGHKHSGFSLSKLFSKKIDLEDILIIAIILIIMHEGKRDDMLLIALIYLLL